MLKDLLKVTAVFAAGAAVGAAVAVLLTPKTGEEMREHLKDLAEDARKRAQDYYAQVKDEITESQKSKAERPKSNAKSQKPKKVASEQKEA